MRDIEDEPTATLEQWSRLDVVRMLEDYFDEVWVYGMREVFDVASEYRLSRCIREKLRFMGYIARGGCAHEACDVPPKRRVLVTVGGGTDGSEILDAYLAGPAELVAESGASSLVVAGPDLPVAAAARLRVRAADLPSVQWVDFTPCLACEVSRSALIVCMGGYNTLCEVVSAGRPALVIPRTHPRLEQAIRARLWERLGLVRVVERTKLTATHWEEEIIRLLAAPPAVPAGTLDWRGLDRICERFGVLLNGRVHRAPALPV
jgi:predicted glycosyltransferase